MHMYMQPFPLTACTLSISFTLTIDIIDLHKRDWKPLTRVNTSHGGTLRVALTKAAE